jgi:hypothetical protein
VGRWVTMDGWRHVYIGDDGKPTAPPPKTGTTDHEKMKEKGHELLSTDHEKLDKKGLEKHRKQLMTHAKKLGLKPKAGFKTTALKKQMHEAHEKTYGMGGGGNSPKSEPPKPKTAASPKTVEPKAPAKSPTPAQKTSGGDKVQELLDTDHTKLDKAGLEKHRKSLMRESKKLGLKPKAGFRTDALKKQMKEALGSVHSDPPKKMEEPKKVEPPKKEEKKVEPPKPKEEPKAEPKKIEPKVEHKQNDAPKVTSIGNSPSNPTSDDYKNLFKQHLEVFDSSSVSLKGLKGLSPSDNKALFEGFQQVSELHKKLGVKSKMGVNISDSDFGALLGSMSMLPGQKGTGTPASMFGGGEDAKSAVKTDVGKYASTLNIYPHVIKKHAEKHAKGGHLVGRTSEEQIKDTVVHEFAHLLSREMFYDPKKRKTQGYTYYDPNGKLNKLGAKFITGVYTQNFDNLKKDLAQDPILRERFGTDDYQNGHWSTPDKLQYYSKHAKLDGDMSAMRYVDILKKHFPSVYGSQDPQEMFSELFAQYIREGEGLAKKNPIGYSFLKNEIFKGR